MKKLSIFFAALIMSVNALYGKMLYGEVRDSVAKESLCYANVQLLHNRIGTICDGDGRFSLNIPDKIKNDSVEFRYIGYGSKWYKLTDLTQDTIMVMLSKKSEKLPELTVKVPRKLKTVKVGKKHHGGLIRSEYSDGNSQYPTPMKGETFGFEVKSKGKQTWLKSVGFYILQCDEMMSKMRFRINIYDMEDVNKSPSCDFRNVLNEPIYFDYKKEDVVNERYEYALPDPILLPDKAMVELEFLDNMNGESLPFKGNLLGKNTWYKSASGRYWDKCPFSVPFFIECVQMK